MSYSILRRHNMLDVAAFAETYEYENMVVACIKIHIRLAPKDHSIFWKTTNTEHHMIPIIKKRFPSHEILFVYRDCLPSAKSSYKALGQSPLVKYNLSHAYHEILQGNLNL